MDLINMFLNLVALPFTFFSFCFFFPPFLFFKSFRSILRSFLSENVAGKVVLITGASSGIGEQLAYEYADRGACLVLAARREKKLEEVANKARELGSPNVISIRADVGKVEDCNRLVDQVVKHFGQLDHLVNNAGITSFSLFEESQDITVFRPLMDVNFWGYIYMTQFAIPHLRRSKGKIVVISSVASWLPTPRMSFYNASKAAIVALYETLRVELGSDVGITIVTPGFVESEMTQGKILSKDGKMEINQLLRDVQVSAIPVVSVTKCAKKIVNSACRGDRYLTVPAWFRVTYLWKLFWSEALELSFRFMYTTMAGTESISKKILDLTGAKKFLYRTTIQSPEHKAD